MGVDSRRTTKPPGRHAEMIIPERKGGGKRAPERTPPHPTHSGIKTSATKCYECLPFAGRMSWPVCGGAATYKCERTLIMIIQFIIYDC